MGFPREAARASSMSLHLLSLQKLLLPGLHHLLLFGLRYFTQAHFLVLRMYSFTVYGSDESDLQRTIRHYSEKAEIRSVQASLGGGLREREIVYGTGVRTCRKGSHVKTTVALWRY